MAVKFKIILEMTCVWILMYLLGIAAGNENEELTRAFVKIHHERSTGSQMFARVDAFGDTYDLVLKKIKMPPVEVLRVDSELDDVPIDVNVTEDLESSDFFFDESKGSLLYLNSDNTLEGAVTESLGIRSENGEHFASRMRKVNHDFCGVRSFDGLQTDFEVNMPQHEMRGSISYTVEVSVLVDSILYGKFNSQSSLVNYLKVYWYLVNRRFRTVNCGTIDIALKKIRYSTSSSIDSKFMHASSSTTSDIDDSLDKMTAYFSDTKYGPFDIAHLMSARDFYQLDGSTRKYSTTGLAWLGTVCKIYSDKAYNTGVSEDGGYYDGVMTTAHEIAHNLGAPHDGSSGATSCKASDGYLMSYVADSYKDFYFSSCSSSAMCDIYSDDTSSCLKTISNTNGFSLTSNLVGGSYTLDEQCQHHSGKSYANADTSVSASNHCYLLQCKYVESPYIYTATYGIPAIEGTYCYPASSGLRCIDGRCQ